MLSRLSARRSGFACFRPANIETCRAFNDVIEAILVDTDPTDAELPHAARFVFIEPYVQAQTRPESADERGQGHRSHIGDDDDDGIDTGTDVETDAENISSLEISQLKYHGGYNLSFSTDPLIPNIGWVIGTGRRDVRSKSVKPNGRVDLLLTAPGTPSAKHEVAGKHARIFFDEDGAITLGIISDRGETVLGNEDIKSGKRRIIAESRCRISFGKLSYIFEFDKTMEEEQYQKDLRAFFRNHLNRREPAPDLSASPSPMDTRIGNWLIRGTVGRGAFGTVNVIKNLETGVTGAVKWMIRDSLESHTLILKEIDMLAALPQHPHILQFLEVHYERGERWYTGILDEADERYSFKTRPERVWIIYRPFARFTFAESIMLKQSIELRLAAFYQTLSGISALHHAGLIHRDIKPANLGVVHLDKDKDQISTVILDYGQTISATSCDPKPGAVGTVPYLAPEMESKPYGPGVDIWACAIVGIQLFITEGKVKWRRVEQEKVQYEIMLKALQALPSNTIYNLLSQMLSYEPGQRISASSALRHPCFAKVNATEALAEI